MNADARAGNSRAEALQAQCPVCKAPALIASSAYGFREELLFLLGALNYRCRNCEVRHAHLFGWTIRLSDPTEDNTPYLVAAAIVSGLLACIAVALWMLRRAHRWPF